MIITCMALMFGIKYLTTYELSHLHWSQTRFYMVWVMGANMAIVMQLFMLNMYKNIKANMQSLRTASSPDIYWSNYGITSFRNRPPHLKRNHRS